RSASVTSSRSRDESLRCSTSSPLCDVSVSSVISGPYGTPSGEGVWGVTRVIGCLRILAMDFTSAAYDVADALAANELYQDNGWTDGLPIVPPTETLVRTFLEAARLAPGDVVGVEPVRRRRITAEKVAIAAVMAGCRPEYMPVVLAVVRALCDPAYGL